MLGLSSSYFAFRKKGIYDSAKSVFDLGFDTVELGAAHSFENGVWETLKKIKLDFPGKNFTVHGLFPPLEQRAWFNASSGLTAENKRVIKNFFRAAEILEADVVSIHPGFRKQLSWQETGLDMADAVFGRQLPKEKSWKGLFAVLKEFSKGAEKTGCAFAIENVPMIGEPLVFSVQDFERVFDEFPNAGLLLDTGHAWFGEMLPELLESYSQKVAQIHLHYSRPKSVQSIGDEHLPIASMQQLEPLKAIRQLKRIPIIFEHGSNVSLEEIRSEKKIVEEFLKGL